MRTVPYHERLTGEDLQVEVCETREEALALWVRISALLEADEEAWRMAARKHTATDWYLMALLLTGSSRLDPFTGRLEIDCEFQFNYAREMQFDGDNVVDYSARQHFKTFWRSYVGVFVETVRDPEITILLIAHEKESAMRYGQRNKQEAEGNVLLKAAWSDVFWNDPIREAPIWSAAAGCVVRRTIISPQPTWSWCSIRDLETGGRVALGIADDLEVEDTVSTPQARRQLVESFTSAISLSGRAARWWVNGTYHHNAGLIAHLAQSKAWRMRCHRAEDLTREPPDIAALYDACGGVLRTRDGKEITLPVGVRSIHLDGYPAFLHPLELAQTKLRHLNSPQGLSQYYMQNMGDPNRSQMQRLDVKQLRYYEGPPREKARFGNLLLTIDPSRGKNDPTVAFLWALRSDENYYLVDGIREKIEPNHFGRKMFDLVARWEGLAAMFLGIRVEVFGQALWDHLLLGYLETVGREDVRVEAIGRNVNNTEEKGRIREWQAIGPLLGENRLILPSCGIPAVSDSGEDYDLVAYLRDTEIANFPRPSTDDCLASIALLGEPANHDKGILQLEFPPTEEFLSAASNRSSEDSSWRPEESGFASMWG